ncbi:MAG TPA: prepilin-type N-terminal cleavage/methylation domain-containing protein [Pyrinomonadaceae bacterium]|jgi:prepilin-type N-terminal cleavage/methylation domain-containing protein|nr:prepilin-type N-terminal cleavage/methylation domain-containing protein [Pyrinomonadaceae bacterium]
MLATRSTHPQGGFSLIELLIVVALLGIISAIAVPYLLAAQQASRAASAVASLRLIHSSEISYRATNDTYGAMDDLSRTGHINDPNLKVGRKNLYDFAVAVGADPARNYTATAVPVFMPESYHHYFIDESGVLRFNVGAAATVASTPVD